MIIQQDNESWWIGVWHYRADKWAAAYVLHVNVVWFTQ